MAPVLDRRRKLPRLTRPVSPPSDETIAQRPERSLAEQLVEQAKADGRSLVGPSGLLADLTTQVLETSLEVEMEEHVGRLSDPSSDP